MKKHKSKTKARRSNNANTMLTAGVQGAAVREIKFRCYQGHGSKQKGHKGLKYTAKMIEWKDIAYKWSMWEFTESLIENNSRDRIMMQYTGMKDKNGKEIYEGDILLADERRKVKVVWHKMAGAWDTDFISDTLPNNGFNALNNSHLHFRTEIIGNIYESAGLLAVAP